MRHYWSNTKTFNILLRILWVIVLLLIIFFLVRSCTECTQRQNIRKIVRERTGYDPSIEDWDNITDTIPPYDDDDTLNLPDRVLLERFYPPIGDQGSFGTCVAWSVGYYNQTALNAIKKGWDSIMLSNPQNQSSAKDMWNAIPSEGKGNNCFGATFGPAFAAIQKQGLASMKDVPYDNNIDCSGISVGDTNNRIARFYHVVGSNGSVSLGQLKAYLADTIPIVIGIKVGDNFMQWNSDKVLTHDTYRYTGPHANHAIALVGYDDDKRAFRLRNSWGESWGDKGSIWVGYDLFFSQMCFEVFYATKD